MKIVEKNEGSKIAYNLDGTRLDFADGALTIDLARYQKDEPVKRDIMVDNEGYLVMGRGRYYVAQVEIPAKEYKETEIPAPVAEEGEEATGGMNNMPGIERTPLPLNTDNVTLYLFAIDGIYIC